jgi:hypothetical protein
MSARMRNGVDLLERVLRGMLGVALIAGVAWAVIHGATPSADIGGLLR